MQPLPTVTLRDFTYLDSTTTNSPAALYCPISRLDLKIHYVHCHISSTGIINYSCSPTNIWIHTFVLPGQLHCKPIAKLNDRNVVTASDCKGIKLKKKL